MKKLFIVLSIIFFSWNLFSQEDAWVYLVDKENESVYLADPILMLSQKAIDRKERHGVSIDSRDIPVNETYISALKSANGITILAKSKWFNTVHIRGEKTDIENLFLNQNSLLDPEKRFIDKIVFADRSEAALERSANNKTKTKLETTLTTFDYGNSANQIEMFNGDVLHQEGYTGEGMTIAIMDGGFPNVNNMSAFQDLRNAGKIIDDYDFVNRDDDVYTSTVTDHGTLVLSTMAGYFNGDGKNFVGTAPDASYYLFITEDGSDENPVEESYWVEAAERADSLGVDIINTSLGYDDFDPGTKYDYSDADMDGNTTFITKGANIAFDKGMLLVTSAGNAYATSIGAPADSPNTLTVGAVDSNGDFAFFSSIGTSYQPSLKPDVVTQGLNSFVIDENDNITTTSGTSFSSPIMAGGVACLWQVFPDLSNLEIINLVRESGSQYNNPDYYLGYGIPDLEVAFNNINALYLIGSNTEFDLKLYPNPVTDKLYISLPTEGVFTLNLFDILGKIVNTFQVSNEFNTIITANLANGIYVARIQTSTGTHTFRLIKQ
ncbi:S8 family peptidase [Algibacter sp. L1A34]|uniref:S8 family peptidase n=1 Tax=Algibacter sp. L1A34 TaxID=2686365 RepID=UPI00131A6B96|nr:S8 family peptidase [Algibacter sp. L1A34]